MQMFETDPLEMRYSYFHEKEPVVVENGGSYADGEPQVSGRENMWSHSLSEVTQALLQAGLSLEEFEEYPYTLVDWPEGVVNVMDDKYAWPHLPAMPMMYSLKMRK